MSEYSELRKETIAKRKALSVSERLKRSDEIIGRIMATDEYKNADTILLYADCNGEVATDRLIAEALLAGKKVYAPVCLEEYKLDFYRIFAIDELQTGAYGIREPLKIEYLKLNEGDITDRTICITPGVVFDRCGHRLGYGKGYYDRFFSTVNIKHRIAPCFDFQITENITPNETDIPMTMIIEG